MLDIIIGFNAYTGFLLSQRKEIIQNLNIKGIKKNTIIKIFTNNSDCFIESYKVVEYGVYKITKENEINTENEDYIIPNKKIFLSKNGKNIVRNCQDFGFDTPESFYKNYKIGSEIQLLKLEESKIMENVFNKLREKKEEFVGEHFITPEKHAKAFFDYMYSELIGHYMFDTNKPTKKYENEILFIDVCCGVGENKDNLFNCFKKCLNDGGADTSKISYFASDLVDFELKKENINDYVNFIYDKTKLSKKIKDINSKLDVLIVMNPPYSNKNIFLEFCVEFHKEFEKRKFDIWKKNEDKFTENINITSMLLLPCSSFSSIGRIDLFNYFDNTSFVGYNKRPNFVKGKHSNLDVCWFVLNNNCLMKNGDISNFTPLSKITKILEV
jgi:hypothetical protein